MNPTMKKIVNKNVPSSKNRLQQAISPVFEILENRMLMSSTITDWAFDNLPTTTGTPITTSPAPSSGSGTANSIGMQTSGTYGTAGASGTGDASYILDGAGNNGTGDYSSTGGSGNGNAWKVNGTSDGWSSNAAIGTQGAQFLVSTVGYSGISLSLDLDASSGKPPSEMQVQYTTDGSTWINATNIATGIGSNGTTDGVTVATNSTNTNIVSGTYFQWSNNADALDWQNGLTANFSSVTAANNDPNFGVRIVNAATGSAEFEVTGTGGTLTPYPAAGAGNYRFDNVQIVATGAAATQPSITTNPTSQTVAAGQPVTFTAVASGNPTPTVQWYQGAVGSGTLISGATSASYTFTTSSTASDNGTSYYAVFTNSAGNAATTAATLTDTLAAPVITTQPTSVSTAAGNTATFTAAASGSPVPTVQWYSEAPAGSSFSPITGATSTTYTVTATTGLSGTKYEAVFTNSQSTATTNVVTLTATGTTLAAWSFSGTQAASASLVSLSASTTGVAVTNNQVSGSPTLSAIGMTEAAGTSNLIDIAPTAGLAHPSFSESLWRIRGTGTGTDTNGWYTLAPEYTQGAEIDLNTSDFNISTLTFDWYSTTSGPKDLMIQYSTNTTAGNWTNLLSTPLVATSNDYYGAASSSPTNTVSLSGISLPANDTSFGLRLVSAYDPNFPSSTEYSSAASNATTQTQIVNTGGNWRFDNFQIVGTQIPVAPAVTTQPTAQSVALGSPVTFTAAASGFPTPTVQWYSGAVGSGTLISGATSASYTFTPTVAQNGSTYYAVFTNSLGTATTNDVALTVNAAPVITVQPVSLYTQAGSTATFTATASGTPTPTVQWQSSTNGTTYTNISGATSTTYTVTAASTNANTAYRAVFTNSAGTTTTNAATLTVIGEAVSQWIFNSTIGETIETNQSDATLISQDAGTADAPLATFTGNPYNSGTGAGDIAQTLGLFNDYQGTPVFSGADINAVSGRSTVNPNYDNFSWRIRSNHTIDGWSQLAPEETTSPDGFGGTLDPQGVLFRVNTTGYTDITLHFQWLGGGIADMQPQYSPDGGTTWIDAGSILQNFSSDYPGITPTTTPAGYFVSLEGPQYSNAYNNPNFEMRLVAAYDPNLPLITDGNLDEPLTVHGQYASSKAGAQNAQQVLDLGGAPTYGANQQNISGGTFELTYGGQTTVPISWTSPTFVADVQSALNALSTIGGIGGTVTVSQELITPFTTSSASNALLNITFGGTLGDEVVPTLTVTNNQLTGSSPTATVSTWIPGAAAAGVDSNGNEVGVTRFEDGGGTWELSDFSFNGLSYTKAPSVVTQPMSQTIVGGTSATFTASDYSESSPVTAQWQINTGSGWTNITGATNYTASSNSSSYTFASNANNSNSGDQFRVVFTNPNGSTNSVPATLTTVAPVAPTVTLQPTAGAAQVGFAATFTATATGSPPPTVQWQVNTGSGWSNLTNGVTIAGANTNTLSITAQASQVGVSVQYRALFTNEVTSVASNAANFTALAPESTITDWNFANSATAVNDSPTPSIGTGTATGLGFAIPYNPSDPASGTDGLGTENIDDITSTPGAANPALVENTWRVRGGTTAGVAGAPANGWSNLAKEYTQGAEFAVSTVGFNSVYITMDWYSTTSGELNAREQYTLDGTNWFNVDDNQLAYNGSTNPNTGLDDLDPNDPIAPLAAVSNDFYGATSTSSTVAVTSVALTNNLATLTANNSYQAGQTVNVTGVASPNTQFNGIFTITAATSTTFSYALTGSNVASTPTTAAASLGGYIIPLVFNLTGVSGAANNPNFGIRLVNTYNPTLPLTSTTLIGDNQPTLHGQYAVASSAASPTVYPGSAGNWRFDNINFHGNSTSQPAWLGTGSQATYDSTTKVLTVTGPTTIIADPGTDEPIIVASGSTATVSVNPASGDTVNIGGLQLSSGAVVTMTSTTTSDILIVAPGGPISIDASSKLDLGKGYADFQATSQGQGQAILSVINGLVTTGYANGLWTGGGIVSGLAAANSAHLTAVGVMLNNGVYGSGAGSLGTFDGTSPASYDVLARYTYYGDANLNGQVDGSDYSLIDSAFTNKSSATWANGNFNYDGTLDGSDYTLIDNAFNSQAAQIQSQIANPQASPATQIAGAKGSKKISPFATGSSRSGFTPVLGANQAAIATASLLSIEQLLLHDKSNTLAGSLVDGLLN